MFKQADVMRAVKAVRAVGLEVIETKIGRDGSISLVHKGAPVQDDADVALIPRALLADS
jgi:hypothetical protein